MTLTAIVAGAVARVPVDPDAEQARDWLRNELSKPEYEAARPSLLEIIGKAIRDWIDSLSMAPGGPGSGLAPLIIIVIVAIALVVAFLVFGLPRLNRRSSISGALFGEDDERSAEQLRDSARKAASDGDYATAIAEQFRAVARGLAERAILTTSPGTTATHFAGDAAGVFPALGAELAASARAFDDVRYLGRAGSAAEYDALVSLEKALRATRPDFAGVPA